MENTRDETKASHHRSHGAVKKPGSVSVDSKEKNMRKQEQIGEEKYVTTSCISASQILWSTGMLSGPIPNGFYSVVPDKKLKELYKDIPTIEDLHDLEANGLKVDVIFVDAEKDKKLSKLKDYIGALVVGSNTTPAAAIKKISGLVSDVYKRQNLGLSPKKASPRASMHSSVSGGVQLLGKIKYGSCRPRALLFKVLADAVGFESRLLVGSPAEGYSECVGSCSHMSVIVVLNSAEFLVDLMRSPGQLVPIASKAIFTTHISAAGGSDSTENDSSDSPIGPESPLYGVSRRVEAQRSEKEDGPLLHRQEPSSNAAGPPMRNTMLRSSSIDRKFSLSQGQQKVIASRGTASSRSEDTPSQMHRLRRRSMSMTTEISDEIVRYMRAMNVSLKPNRLPQEHEEGGSESTSSNVSSVVLDNESGDMSSLYATQRKHISQKSEALHLSPQGVDEVVSMWNRVMSLPIFQDKPLLPFDEWNIDFSELTFGTRVGIGFFGEVFRGVWNGMEVAVKLFLEQDLTAENMEDFCNEISILSRLRHPNVILFLGACLTPPRLSLITEYMDFGSLFNLIHTSGQNHTISWSRRLKMLRDICRGLMYIHRMKIIHLDLKSANCLVSKHWTVKICDFGLSKLMTDSPITTPSASGTPEWMAPEVIRCEPFTEKCDIYSFGVIVWELYTLHKPWEGVATTRVIHNVANEGLRLEIPSGPVGRIIADCLAEPEARPNCEEILTRLLDNDLFLL